MRWVGRVGRMRWMGMLIGIFGSAHDFLLRWVNKRIPALTTIPYAILISRDAKARGSEIYGLPRPAVGIVKHPRRFVLFHARWIARG